VLGHRLEHRVAAGAVGQLLALGDDLGLGRRQRALQPAQHHQRQDHLAVLVGLEVAAQQVGDAPHEADLVGEAGGWGHRTILPGGHRTWQ